MPRHRFVGEAPLSPHLTERSSTADRRAVRSGAMSIAITEDHLSLASTARDFLARWNPERTGCVVVDVRMPEMDGCELQAELTRRHQLAPLILMTGYTADGERAVLQDGEVAAWLDKPPSSWVLACAVAEALARG